MRESLDQLESAGHGRDRLHGMYIGEAGQARQPFIEARVVLHRAGAKRVETGVDCVVLLREAGEVAHDLRLAEPRQPDRAFPFETSEAAGEGCRLGQVDAGMTRRILLEEQTLFDLEPPVPPDGLYRRRGIALARANGPAPI